MISDNELHKLFQRVRTIAIVGLSDRPERDSYAIARFLQRNGYTIIPVNPKLHAPVLGVAPVVSLRDIAVHVDVVDVFRRPEFLPEVAREAAAIGADVLWGQLGVVNAEAAQIANAAGLQVVMDRCMAIEYRRLSRYAEQQTPVVI